MNGKNGSILVVSGPSGSGKTSLARVVCEELGQKAYFSISSTTRPMREGEKEGVDYFFLSNDEFIKDIEEGYFLEWAEVHGNFYGTSKRQIDAALKKGQIVFLDIDVQGYELVKKSYPDITTGIFVTTPNQEVLKQRLLKRGTETEESMKVRMFNALREMEKIDEYEFLLINDDFDEAKHFLRSVAISSLIKTSKYNTQEFINEWKGNR